MTMLRYEINIGERTYRIELEPAAQPSESAQPNSVGSNSEMDWNVRIDGREIPVNCLRVSEDSLSLLIDGESFNVRGRCSSEGGTIFFLGESYEFTVRDPRAFRGRSRTAAREGGEQKVTASMPGKVVRLLARAGEPIQAGQGILVIEAMKMQNEVRAAKSGILKSISAQLGANVNAGEVLAIIE